jgi:hypothetical protein
MIDQAQLLHDLTSLHGVLKTLRNLAAGRDDSSDKVLELHSLAIEKVESLIVKLQSENS